MEFSRRDFLKTLAISLAGVSVGCGGGGSDSTIPIPDGPNILVFLTDDQAAKAVGYTGEFPFLTTPHMDRVAREGVTFENSFVTTSLCSPGRASLLTGLTASSHGVINNSGIELASDIPTFPQLLQQAGYETAFVGKWHMNSSAEPRPGFDYWLSFGGQGVYVDPVLNENGVSYQAAGYITDILTQKALDWLTRPRTKPFCLFMSHKAVHQPFTPPTLYIETWRDELLPEPANFQDSYAGKPAWLRRLILYGADEEQWVASSELSIPIELPPNTWDQSNDSLMNYFRCLEAVDDSLGALIAELERQKSLDVTALIVTSDNGFFLGAHRLWDKRLMYEESIRVPLMIRYPKLISLPRTVKEMVLNIDLAPTILDLAGVKAPQHFEGSSLKSLLTNDPQLGSWRTSFFYEYFPEVQYPGYPKIQGVRTGEWKYIHYPERIDDLDELYDLTADPLEMTNLIAMPEYAEMLAEFRTLLANR